MGDEVIKQNNNSGQGDQGNDSKLQQELEQLRKENLRLAQELDSLKAEVLSPEYMEFIRSLGNPEAKPPEGGDTVDVDDLSLIHI